MRSIERTKEFLMSKWKINSAIMAGLASLIIGTSVSFGSAYSNVLGLTHRVERELILE